MDQNAAIAKRNGSSITLATLIALLPAAAFFFVAFSRLRYPLDLEWLEGTIVEMGWRWARGLPLYTVPSIQHIAQPYFPLYFMIIGFLYRWTGPVYWVGRLVSIFGTTATAALAYWIVRRETKHRLLGLVAAGLWFATFGFNGFFFDLNRVDSLAMFFLLAAYAVAFYRSGILYGALAGLLLAASVLTKQNHLAFIAPIVFAQLMRKEYRGAAALVAAFALVLVPSIWFLNRDSHGWFWLMTMKFVRFYVRWPRATMFFLRLVRYLAIPLAVIVLFLLRKIDARRWREILADPWLGFWFASVALSLLFQLPPGGYLNANMPAALATAIASCLLLPRVLAAERHNYAWLRNPRRWLIPLATAAAIFLASSRGVGQIPPPDRWRVAQELRSFVRAQKGVVVIPELAIPEPNVLTFHEVSYNDLRHTKRGVWTAAYLAKIQKELADLKPDVVIASGDYGRFPTYHDLVVGMTGRALEKNLRVWVVTGRTTQLSWVFTRPKPLNKPPPQQTNR